MNRKYLDGKTLVEKMLDLEKLVSDFLANTDPAAIAAVLKSVDEIKASLAGYASSAALDLLQKDIDAAKLLIAGKADDAEFKLTQKDIVTLTASLDNLTKIVNGLNGTKNRGHFATVAELVALANPNPDEFAWVGQAGDWKVYVYENGAWAATGGTSTHVSGYDPAELQAIKDAAGLLTARVTATEKVATDGAGVAAAAKAAAAVADGKAVAAGAAAGVADGKAVAAKTAADAAAVEAKKANDAIAASTVSAGGAEKPVITQDTIWEDLMAFALDVHNHAVGSTIASSQGITAPADDGVLQVREVVFPVNMSTTYGFFAGYLVITACADYMSAGKLDAAKIHGAVTFNVRGKFDYIDKGEVQPVEYDLFNPAYKAVTAFDVDHIQNQGDDRLVAALNHIIKGGHH